MTSYLLPLTRWPKKGSTVKKKKCFPSYKFFLLRVEPQGEEDTENVRVAFPETGSIYL